MNRRFLGDVVLCLLVMTALFCWRFCGIQYEQLKKSTSSTATMWTENDPVSLKRFLSMQKAEADREAPATLAAWTQINGQELTALVSEKTAQADMLLLRGDVRLLLPAAPALAEDDFSGCLLDRETAQILYGAELKSGSVLRLNEREYTVRGLFDAPSGTVILQADPWETRPFTRLTYSGKATPEEFAMRHRLTVSFAMKNKSYALAGGVLYSLAPLAGILCLVLRLSLAAGQSRFQPVKHAFWTLCAVAVGTAGLLILLRSMPQEWLPDRWSNFEFWQELFQSGKEFFLRWFSVKKDAPDLWMVSKAGACLSGLGAFGVVIVLFRHMFLQGMPVSQAGIRPPMAIRRP